MSNLEKIQKGMRVLQTLSKIILILAIVGTALTATRGSSCGSGCVKSGKPNFFIFCPLWLK